MRTHILWIVAGVLIGGGLGAAGVANALSCSQPQATVTLELLSVTVGGEERALETGPPSATLRYAGRNPDTGRFMGSHTLDVESVSGASQAIFMDYVQ